MILLQKKMNERSSFNSKGKGDKRGSSITKMNQIKDQDSDSDSHSCSHSASCSEAKNDEKVLKKIKKQQTNVKRHSVNEPKVKVVMRLQDTSSELDSDDAEVDFGHLGKKEDEITRRGLFAPK